MTEVVEGEAAALQVLGEDSVPDTRANRDSESYLVNLARVEHVKGYQYPGTVRDVLKEWREPRTLIRVAPAAERRRSVSEVGRPIVRARYS